LPVPHWITRYDAMRPDASVRLTSRQEDR
jgi:hypothetical protein